MTDPTKAQGGQAGAVRPRAWLCEFMQEDGTTRVQFVAQDPSGLRWNDAGEPSPYSVTPLYEERDSKVLRAALAELLACHTESAGWSMSMLANRAEFDAMLVRSQERLECAIGAARQALGTQTMTHKT